MNLSSLPLIVQNAPDFIAAHATAAYIMAAFIVITAIFLIKSKPQSYVFQASINSRSAKWKLPRPRRRNTKTISGLKHEIRPTRRETTLRAIRTLPAAGRAPYWTMSSKDRRINDLIDALKDRAYRISYLEKKSS
jgi:hypothetical protein